ncbi:MAG: host attachment protein [Myxococcales bacterium]|nr:host attachment protein [Myxococcales bacterium]
MESTWFVVADRAGAQVYEVAGSKMRPTLRPLESLTHSEVREHDDSAGSSSSHQLMLDTSGADAEKDRRFVRQVVDHLHQARHRRAFSRLLIAAPADFVGHVRDMSKRSLSTAIHREIIGDYTHDTPRALTERMRRKNWLD